jgi:hypothetical protein
MIGILLQGATEVRLYLVLMSIKAIPFDAADNSIVVASEEGRSFP